MTRDEWLAVLATEPATQVQVGAIQAEFARLGFGEHDRAERLAVCAALLGVAELGSTCHLVMGDAGRLLRLLRDCPDRAALNRAVPRLAPARPDGPRLTLAEALAGLLAILTGPPPRH